MSDRQYGLPHGYRQDAGNNARDHSRSIDRYNNLNSQQHDGYAPSNQSYAMQPQQYTSYDPSNQPSVRSPPRRPVAPYERRAPPPTAYDAPPPSYDGGSYNARPTHASPERRPLPQQPRPDPRPSHQYGNSQSSVAPLTSHAAAMPDRRPSPPRSQRSGAAGSGMSGYGYGQYDHPVHARPYRGDGYDDFMDPRDIADDEGDGYDQPTMQRQSRFGKKSAMGAGLGGAAGAAAGALGTVASRDASGSYAPVGKGNADAEKSEWLQKQNSGRRRLMWIVGVIAVLIIVAIVGGVVAGVLRNSSGGSSAPDVSEIHGLLDIHSSQVQDVMDNGDLHKVFPGMDYTPINAQYPACLSNPPDQNNVTLDVAVLSQLTPAIRLYGTDCKQTEMVLTAIDKLEMNDTVKVWLGVWLGTNVTTNTRQLNQMYDILDTYPTSHFAGVIVGNEVLFREDLTITQLAGQLTSVRNGLAKRSIDLPVATSDLGDDWTAALAADSDIVMANVHPFFAGVTPKEAPGWTWSFWQTHDVILTGASSGAYPNNIISETGWPSEGGNDCGTGGKCPTKTVGAVAGIDEMNEFMDGWVCQSLANGTTYFWFEAFDEPWKEMFNDPKTGDFWEPHWGLMDVNRNLKDGVKIPDCGGKTIDKPY